MRVRIFQPSKSAMQSRCSCGNSWVIEPLLETVCNEGPFTGNACTDAPLTTLTKRLMFATSGDALTFARAKGWDFELDQPNERKQTPKNYADNFNPDRRRIGR